jgi:hypothetical protein
MCHIISAEKCILIYDSHVDDFAISAGRTLLILFFDIYIVGSHCVLSPLYYNNNKKNKCDISAHCAQSKN